MRCFTVVYLPKVVVSLHQKIIMPLPVSGLTISPLYYEYVQICTKCVRCKSCGATTPGSSNAATWTVV
ncbi:hypothetical protein KUTeg_006306 [Tegillarca granosa]|uniref:Uncharacterized protein n=1 Tax=Tegillarca granosa TaxID=220873 RepID=A0ABQ9FIB9_TEGGR|nr:hypothetical protein KUTeg_006306 [Tegillarca granosa]